MTNGYSAEDLLDFLRHAGERGLMPVATAQALAVSCRKVFDLLDNDERADLRKLDVQQLLKRFGNKRAKDFSSSSLKEYGRRVQRAIELFITWRDDPANFSVKTRVTAPGRKNESSTRDETASAATRDRDNMELPSGSSSGYQSAFPVRPGAVVTLSNIPHDLTKAEAERIAAFVRMLAVE